MYNPCTIFGFFLKVWNYIKVKIFQKQNKKGGKSLQWLHITLKWQSTCNGLEGSTYSSLPLCGSDLTSYAPAPLPPLQTTPLCPFCCSLFLWQAWLVVLVNLSIWLESSSLRWPWACVVIPLFLFFIWKATFFFSYLESNVGFLASPLYISPSQWVLPRS